MEIRAPQEVLPDECHQAPNSLWRSTWRPLWPTATLLPGGAVFIAGNSPAELYDPPTGMFCLTATMTAAEYRYGMYWHTSTLLPNGKVLIASGTDDTADLANAELYDPSTETFAATDTMPLRRSLHTASLLPNGTVLIAGGETCDGEGSTGSFGGSVSSAEYYDPITGNFVPTGSMSATRSGHTATLLTDGTVLITGGMGYAPFQLGTKFHHRVLMQARNFSFQALDSGIRLGHTWIFTDEVFAITFKAQRSGDSWCFFVSLSLSRIHL
jgi:hypothetical protein